MGELFTWETGQDKKAGEVLFFVEVLLEHVTVNRTEAFGIPPNKGNRGQYFVYTLPFYKQQVYKQTVLAC